MQPVIAPGQRQVHAERPFIGIGAACHAFGVPACRRQQPVLGPGQHVWIIGHLAADGQMPDRIDQFLTVDISLPPDMGDTFMARISGRLRHDVPIHPWQHGFFKERRPGAVIGIGFDRGFEIVQPVRRQPKPGVIKVQLGQTRLARCQRRFWQAICHGKAALSAPAAGGLAILASGVRPGIAARCQCIGGRKEIQCDVTIDRFALIAGDAHCILRLILQHGNPGKARRVLDDFGIRNRPVLNCQPSGFGFI